MGHRSTIGPLSDQAAQRPCGWPKIVVAQRPWAHSTTTYCRFLGKKIEKNAWKSPQKSHKFVKWTSLSCLCDYCKTKTTKKSTFGHFSLLENLFLEDLRFKIPAKNCFQIDWSAQMYFFEVLLFGGDKNNLFILHIVPFLGFINSIFNTFRSTGNELIWL